MKLKSVVFLFVLFLTSYSLYSQQDTLYVLPDRLQLTEENLMKEVPKEQGVMAASRSFKKIEDLPMTVIVVTRDEIIQNNYITLTDVLKTLPAIRVSQPGSGEMGHTFQMRGLLGNKYTKILINNIPIQPTATRGMPISAQIPIRQAERIEIIYGPSSSIYGADATAGVINIVLKEVTGSTFTQADASIGTGDFSYFNFMVGGRAGKNKNIFDYTIFGNRYNWRDMDVYSDKNNVYSPLSYFELDTEDPGIQIGNEFYRPSEITDEILDPYPEIKEIFYDSLLNDNYEGTISDPAFARIPDESSMFGMTFKYRNFNVSFLHMDRQAHSSLGQTSYYFKYNNPLNFWGENIQRYTVGYEKSGRTLHSSTNLSYVNYEIKNQSSKGLTYLNSTDTKYFYSASDDIFAEQLFVWSKNKNLEITAGGSFQYSGNLPITNDLMEPFDPELYEPFSKEVDFWDTLYGDFGINPITFSNTAGYIQTYFTLWRFTTILGGRIDYNSLYSKKSNSLRGAIMYKKTNKRSFRFAWGQSYKAPSSSEIYQSLAISDIFDEGDPFPPNATSYEMIPNESLKPELFGSIELGFRRQFKKSHLNLTFYNYEIRNLIVPSIVPVEPGTYPNNISLTARQNTNNSVAEAQLLGLQFAMKYYNLVDAIKLKADFSFDFNVGEEVLPDGDTLNTLRGVPVMTGLLNLSAEPFKNTYIRISNNIMGPWTRSFIRDGKDRDHPYSEVPGYYSMDLVVGYTFGKHLTGFFNIKNVLGSKYGGIDVSGLDVDLHHNPQPGRVFRFGVTYRRN